jgi:prefoldin subunit 5
MTLTLTERMHNKANTHNTINSCSDALDAVHDALGHFEAEHQKSGLFLDYLNQLYEERDALLRRKKELTRNPTAAQNVAMLRRALLEIKSCIDAAEQGESEVEVLFNLRRADQLCAQALYPVR